MVEPPTAPLGVGLAAWPSRGGSPPPQTQAGQLYAPHPFFNAKNFLDQQTLTCFLSGQRELGRDEGSTKPCRMVQFLSTTTMGEALQALATHRILSGPVIDAHSGEYVGLADVGSLLAALVEGVYGAELFSPLAPMTDAEFLEACRQPPRAALDRAGKAWAERPLADLLTGGDLWFHGDAESTLLEVVRAGFHVTKEWPTVVSPLAPRRAAANPVHQRVAVFDIVGHGDQEMSDGDDPSLDKSSSDLGSASDGGSSFGDSSDDGCSTSSDAAAHRRGDAPGWTTSSDEGRSDERLAAGYLAGGRGVAGSSSLGSASDDDGDDQELRDDAASAAPAPAPAKSPLGLGDGSAGGSGLPSGLAAVLSGSRAQQSRAPAQQGRGGLAKAASALSLRKVAQAGAAKGGAAKASPLHRAKKAHRQGHRGRRRDDGDGDRASTPASAADPGREGAPATPAPEAEALGGAIVRAVAGLRVGESAGSPDSGASAASWGPGAPSTRGPPAAEASNGGGLEAPAMPGGTLAAEAGLLRQAATTPRLPSRLPRSSSGWRIRAMISQTDVVRVLLSNVDNLDSTFGEPIGRLGLVQGPNQITILPAETPALTAFAYIRRHGLSGLGLTDQAGRLVGSLAASDLRGVSASRLGMLTLSTLNYLAFRAAHVMGCRDPACEACAAANAGDAGGAVAEAVAKAGRRLPQLVSVPPTAPLRDVARLLVANTKRRVYVIDAEHRAIGVVTPTDILRLVSS